METTSKRLAALGLLALLLFFAFSVTGCFGVPVPQTPRAQEAFTFPATWTPAATSTPRPTGTPVLNDQDVQPQSTLAARPTLAPSTGRNRIAFSSNRTGKHAIYVMDWDGSDLERITSGQEDEMNPAWSPDGNALAFMAYTKQGGSSTERGKVFTVNADGTGRRMLIDDRGVDMWPAWAPDGRRIMFAGAGQIKTIQNNGVIKTLVSVSSANLRNPKWSPSGYSIAFAAETLPAAASAKNEPITKDIYLANANGSNIQFLAHGEMPAWSPDGTQIVFDAETEAYAQIFVISVDGSGLAQLTHGPGRNVGPDWSPDGKQIAFSSLRDENWEIYIMNADGTDQKRITNNPASDLFPAWRP